MTTPSIDTHTAYAMAGFPPQNITAMIVQAQLAKQQVVEMERSHVVVDAKSHRRK